MISQPILPTRCLPLFSRFLPLLLLVAVVVGCQRSEPSVELQISTAPGSVLMGSQMKGWANTSQPITESDLAGKWVVIDCWATWCGPCIASLPHVAEFRDRWQEKGVVVLGVTSEKADALPEIQNVILGVEGFTWPVAYGGDKLFKQLGIENIPTVVLFDPSGKLVYSGHDLDVLEAKLIAGQK